MEPKSVDISRGIAWFGGGWRIFMYNPGVWVVLAVMFLVITFVLGLIPIFGVLALSLLMPVLTAGLVHAAREADAGRPLDVLLLFQGFREQGKLTPLLALGGVGLLGLLVSMMLAILLGGASMLAMMSGSAHELSRGAGAGILLALLAVLAVQLAVVLALMYAVPLVYFCDTPVGQALASSLRANLRNLLPLLVFGVVYLFAAIAATLPFFLGWIVLLPVSAGTLYLSYRDIYGAD